MLSNCTFSILGDSYSTFEGFIPDNYDCYYPNPGSVDDVLCVNDTWWYKLIQHKGMRLLVNDSYSGSTVCSQVREQHPKEAAFVERVKKSFADDCGNAPDYIMVLGCTNDNWIGREIGEVQFGDWSEDDLKQTLPSYCFVVDHLTKTYPASKVVSIINTLFEPKLAAGMKLAGEHYGLITVELQDIDKQNGHPSAAGMNQIAEQVYKALEDAQRA